MKSRRLLAAVVTVLASIAMLATLLAYYANHALLNSASFSGRALSVVHTGAVESLIVEDVTNHIIGSVGDQASVRPTLEDAVREALSSAQIAAELRAAATSLQSQLVSGPAKSLSLTLPDGGSAIAASIESRSPQLAAEISRIGAITVVDVPIPSAAVTAVHDLATVGRDSSLLLVFTAALAALALILTPERRRTLLGLGLGALAAGLLAAVAYLAGRGLVVNQFSTQAARTAAGAAWSVYLGGLESSGFALAGVGVVIASAAALASSRTSRSRPGFIGA
jgi:hypothetical protein